MNLWAQICPIANERDARRLKLVGFIPYRRRNSVENVAGLSYPSENAISEIDRLSAMRSFFAVSNRC